MPSMRIVHLTSSRFYGGPERQMLALAGALPEEDSTVFVSFSEDGTCQEFLAQARAAGFPAVALKHDTPRLLAARRELVGVLRQLRADVLLCHGYKANLLGLMAGRKLGISVVAVSRGWTGECLKVRLYEALDRHVLRWMDRVVSVSAAQAEKVRRAGVHADKIAVIHNAIRLERFDDPDPAYRRKLLDMFPEPPALVVGAAGRLSPEKGFGVLIEAAARVGDRTTEVRGKRPEATEQGAPGGNGRASALCPLPSCLCPPSASVGFVLFGDGPMRDALSRQIAACGLERSFVLAGFRTDLDRFFPHFDLFVQSSYTEGLPNVILEAQAAGVPVVATSVGGTPEVIENDKTGWLAPAGDAAALAERVACVLADDPTRAAFSRRGRANVEDRFSFAAQARQYQDLFTSLLERSFLARDVAVCVEESAIES